VAPGAVVWVNSPDILYRMNMADLTLDAAWYFDFRDGSGAVRTGQEMVDIALSSAGEMYGISRNPTNTGTGTRFLYHVLIPPQVGTGVARADQVGELTYWYNALTFAPAGMADPAEVLLAVDNDPSYINSYLDQLDLATASSTYVGPFGNDLKSSGDIVAVQGLGLYASVKDAAGTNILARVDPMTGTATLLGTGMGYPDVWGLAFWNGDVLGFTKGSITLRVNPQTGAGTGVWTTTPPVVFMGAAVNPLVPLHVP
jgi:hypothetical protein